jgi:hypothetical protein
MSKKAKLILYISGDNGSKEIINMAKRKMIDFDVRDIRHRDVEGKLSALEEIHKLTPVRSVPIAIAPNNSVMDTYDLIKQWVVAQPNKPNMPSGNVA